MRNKKNIIITGTSRGIGFKLAPLFAKAGHEVLALSRNAKPLKALQQDGITALPFDISENADFEKVKDFIKSEWDMVDILIHNAGFLVNTPFVETNMEDFKKVYGINVFGVAQLTQSVLPFMQAGAHVVTISSMGGIQGSTKFAGLAAYSSSKAAVITLNELLAEEYKERGIAFNTLALGAVQTEMLGEAFPGYKAPLSAEEMATYIFDFALSGNVYFNGKTLQVSSTTP